MSKKPEDLIALRKDQIKPASRILARAFMDDPISMLAYPHEKERQTRLAYMYEFSLRYSFSSNQIYTTSDRLEGVTAWRRRGIHHPDSFWHLFSSGAIWPFLKAGLGTGKRMLPFYEYIEYEHQGIISSPHWYLIGLGVDPNYQGQGYGARMHRQMQIQINKEKLPCYLETAKEKNVNMYQHLGFRVMDEFTVPGTIFKVWAMLKE
jgi:ribosomal protein S18 acetylase RimI-like enzyme